MLLLSLTLLLMQSDAGNPGLVLIGSSDPSHPGGTMFWRPGNSIATGIPGHVAQHVTLAGSSCPSSQKSCEAVMLTKDSGATYSVAFNASEGTATSNFNGYGDLGTLVPAATHNTTASPAGQFNTLVGVGSNGCKRSGNVLCPAYLLTWLDGHDGLKVVKNTTITMTSTPTSFLAPNSWISSPTQTIIRTANNSLLLAVYGKVSDGKMICSGGKKLCYTTAFYGSSDDGATWKYASRIDATANMTAPDDRHGRSGPNIEGPSQASMALLPDGRVMAAFTLLTGEGADATINGTAAIVRGNPGGNQGTNLWNAYSSDGGGTWTDPVPMVGCPGVRHDPKGIYPQMRVLANGMIIFSTGGPNLAMWLSMAPGPKMTTCWSYSGMMSFGSGTTGTSGYTGVAEVEPNVVLVAFDEIPVGKEGTAGIQKVMRIVYNFTRK